LNKQGIGVVPLTEHDEPLGTLDTVFIGLGVTERLPLALTGLVDLTLGTVADEDGLATPLDDDLFGVLDKDFDHWKPRMGWRM
jgi:hypothetical protein